MTHVACTFARPTIHTRISGLIFDMDGTILDTRRYHMAAWKQLVARLGLSEDFFHVAEAMFGRTNWAVFEHWYGRNGHGADFDALSDEKEANFRRLIAGREQPRPGFLELLRWARDRNLRIALATSGPRENAEFLLADLGIELMFDAVVWADAATRGKPHPEPFLKAAARLGLPPQRCLAFEDSGHGFWSVRRAGMPLVGIAEQPGQLDVVRRWTPFAYTDFRPVRPLMER